MLVSWCRRVCESVVTGLAALGRAACTEHEQETKRNEAVHFWLSALSLFERDGIRFERASGRIL